MEDEAEALSSHMILLSSQLFKNKEKILLNLQVLNLPTALRNIKAHTQHIYLLHTRRLGGGGISQP
jgi:hypothetical protein